ncbi:hypothetical protein GIB67_021117 [Kingdonia uniflora]|uniref:Uncharacterized protein n=1 Tax=Kingdonia uniflora TaxID=39325 RepID=A0A7J7N7T7_9MAGN|nr:hypothetical protein GIB67_021117 [Kingdonia uniflora]
MKVITRKRRRVLGEDDAEDEDEEMTEAERQAYAVAKCASMVELCEYEPDEALKEIKRSMFQQTDAWAESNKKAIKSAKGKLRQAIKSLDLVRGTEASLVSEVKVLKQDLEAITSSFNERLEHQRSKQERVWAAKLAVKEREKAEYEVSYLVQFDNEYKVNVRVKEFIEEKGYNPDTLEPFPIFP